MRGFLEKCGDGEKNRKQKTEKKTENRKKNRDETEFIGPIPPVGVGPKNVKMAKMVNFHCF